MAESCTPAQSGAFPLMGIAGERTGKPVIDALRRAKREAVEAAMGKEDSWCRKIINGNSGVMLDDIDDLLAALDLKAVPKHKRCVDPELLRSYETIARKAMAERSLFEEDAE